MSETVIKTESLWKQYRFGVVSSGLLFRDFQSWLAKVRRKEGWSCAIGIRTKNPVAKHT
jgi:hypothetical protein